MKFTLFNEELKQNVALVEVKSEAELAQWTASGKLRAIAGWLNLNTALDDAEMQQALAKGQRNKLLEQYSWTVLPHSPLTPANQRQWLTYLKSLHKVLLQPAAQKINWPKQPKLEYADD